MQCNGAGVQPISNMHATAGLLNTFTASVQAGFSGVYVTGYTAVWKVAWQFTRIPLQLTASFGSPFDMLMSF